MPQPQVAPEMCQRKQSLTESIREAMSNIMALNNHELDAAIKGQFAELEKIKVKLVEARKRKDASLEEYQRHVRTHRC